MVFDNINAISTDCCSYQLIMEVGCQNCVWHFHLMRSNYAQPAPSSLDLTLMTIFQDSEKILIKIDIEFHGHILTTFLK